MSSQTSCLIRGATFSATPEAGSAPSRSPPCCRRWLLPRLGCHVADPLAPKPPHFKPTAKSVIWLFMEGGPSHIDLFDPKPALEKLAGQPMPASFGKPITAMGTAQQHADALQAHMEAARPERHLGFRLVSRNRQTRRRDDGVPRLLGGRPESRRLGLPDEHVLDSGGPAGAGRLGDVWARFGESEPAQLSSC